MKKKIVSFDRSICKMLNEEITDAIKPLAEKYGLSILPAGGSYDELSYTKKIKLQVKETESGKSGAAAEFARYAPMFGLPEDAFGKTFISSSGTRFRINGIRPKATRAPVIAINDNGVAYKFSAETVKFCLNKK